MVPTATLLKRNVKTKDLRSSLLAQWMEALVLSLLGLRSHGFDPWPRFFRMPQAWPKQKQTNKKTKLNLFNFSKKT